jgi:CAAX amino terminal protease family.
MILACVISSMIFGFLHIVNIFAGDPVLATLSQIVDATAIGLFFAVVFLRTKKLWIPILLHGLLNLSVQIFDAIVSPDLLFQSSTPQTEVDIIGLIIYTLFITLPMLTAALVLLRKVGQ